MYRELMHIYGPFSIHSFGVMIALGVIIFLWRAEQHPLRKKYMSADALIDVVTFGTFIGIIGGRLLYILTEWHTFTHWTSFFNIWEGGVSLLGTVLTCVIGLPLYLHYRNIPTLPCLDLIGLHAPLLQGISRLGCFLAGCCYGKAANVAWSITYTTNHQAAPMCIPLHPTQLYSAFMLILIFFILDWIYKKYTLHEGQYFALYLMLTNAERFSVDFLRGDQEFYAHPFFAFLSIHQWIALGLFTLGLCGFIVASRTRVYSRPL